MRKCIRGTGVADCCSILVSYVAIGWIFAGCLAGCTTQGVLVQAESSMFARINGPDRGHKTVAVFLNWHDGCAFGICETHRLALHDRAAACIQSGLRHVNPEFRAVPGLVELHQDTSALVADPREHGQPDSRFHPTLVASLLTGGIHYAVVVDVSRAQGVRESERWVEGAQYVFGFGQQEQSTVHGRAEAILVDIKSQRWLGRVRRVFRGTDIHNFGVLFVPIPLPLVSGSSSSAAIDACESAGEALGQLLSRRPE